MLSMVGSSGAGTGLSLSTLLASRGTWSFSLGLDAGVVDKAILGVTTGVLLDSGSIKGVNYKDK
jgi:hypothetical protein